MKTRFNLFRRAGVFYTEDTATGKQTSLRTKDETEAKSLLNARNEAQRQPVLNLHLARAYLTASDPAFVERTWQTVMDQLQARGNRACQAPQRGDRRAGNHRRRTPVDESGFGRAWRPVHIEGHFRAGEKIKAGHEARFFETRHHPAGIIRRDPQNRNRTRAASGTVSETVFQLALPVRFQVVSPHEGQPVPVEHETDVDEKHAVAGAAVKKFLFQQFAQAAPKSPFVQARNLARGIGSIRFYRSAGFSRIW